jgi:hypothetical protein
MNPEVKDRWVEALRSGRFKQGRWVLDRINPDGEHQYCCLGVLTALCKEDGVDLPEVIEPLFSDDESMPERRVRYGESECGSLLPQEVAEWAGIDPAVLCSPSGSSNAASWKTGFDVRVRSVAVISVALGSSSGYTTLSNLNDGGASFSVIADRIEESL